MNNMSQNHQLLSGICNPRPNRLAIVLATLLLSLSGICIPYPIMAQNIHINMQIQPETGNTSLEGTTMKPAKTIAHRGLWNAEGSAQNSIASLTKADEAQIYGTEFDVQMTKDGVAVVNHDATLYGIRIEDTNYKDLKKLRLINGEPLPTLEAYLKKAKTLKNGIRLVLEVKPHRSRVNEDKCVSEVLRIVGKYGLEARTSYISFSKYACGQLAKLAPEGTDVAYLGGDLTPQEVKQLALTGIDYEQSVLRKHPEWIEEAHRLGLTVNVWTVNDEENIRFFYNMKVDFLTTNDPLLAQKIALGER